MQLIEAVVLVMQSQHWALVSVFDPMAYRMHKSQEQPVVSLDIFSRRKTPHRTVASAVGKLVSLMWHTLIMFPNNVKLRQNTKRFNSFLLESPVSKRGEHKVSPFASGIQKVLQEIEIL